MYTKEIKEGKQVAEPTQPIIQVIGQILPKKLHVIKTDVKIKIMGKFIIKQRVNDEYQFTLMAENNIILMSEGYTTKANCHKGIESVRINSQDNSKYDRRLAVNGKNYFVLKARNGEIIGKSPYYSSKPEMENGIAAVKSNAPTAEIVDETL